MAGFFGISLSFKEVEYIEPAIGFKGLSLSSDRRQYIEPSIGFKGISLSSPSTGFAIVIENL